MKAFLKKLQWFIKKVTSDEFQRLVSSLSFTTALSIVPVLGLYFWLVQSLGFLENQLPLLEEVFFAYLTPMAAEQIKEQVMTAINRTSARASGLTSLVLLIFLGFRLSEDLRKGVLGLMQKEMTTPWWKRFVWFLFMIGLSPLLFLFIAATTWLVSFIQLNVLVNLGTVIPWTLLIGLFYGWAMGFLSDSPALSKSQNTSTKNVLQETVTPTPPHADPTNALVESDQELSPSRPKIIYVSLGVALLISGANHLFILLVENVFQYNSIYGTLAVLPIFLIWLSIFWNFILAGLVWVLGARAACFRVSA